MNKQRLSSEGCQSHAIPEVLAFYKTLPFNYYGSTEKQAESLIKNEREVLEANACLIPVLSKAKQVLDVGCGAGFLANTIALKYSCSVLGIDFNPVALERARDVAIQLKLQSEFLTQDLFMFRPTHRYDLIVSLGVLHHTRDCQEAIRCLIRNCLSQEGYLYLGLYHQFGRSPFLKYFGELKKTGASEDRLYEKYTELHSHLRDATHLKSWFRDQVLHPFETQHTLAEMFDLMDEMGLEIISTSINKFKPFNSRNDLFELEKKMKLIGEHALQEKRYFPGFFTFLAKKHTDD